MFPGRDSRSIFSMVFIRLNFSVFIECAITRNWFNQTQLKSIVVPRENESANTEAIIRSSFTWMVFFLFSHTFAKDFIWQMRVCVCVWSANDRPIYVINKLLAKNQHFIVVSLESFVFFLVSSRFSVSLVVDSCSLFAEQWMWSSHIMTLNFAFTTKTNFYVSFCCLCARHSNPLRFAQLMFRFIFIFPLFHSVRSFDVYFFLSSIPT